MTNPVARLNTLPVSIEWTSDSGGDATVILPDYSGYNFVELITMPGTGGAAPTDAYDVTLVYTAMNVDILVGEGADRSGTVTDAPINAYGIKPIPGVLTFTVTNAGNAKKGSALLTLARS